MRHQRLGTNFNPRSPHGERRYSLPKRHKERYFNPRSPHGERQAVHRYIPRSHRDFNPRSPHGERPFSDSALFSNQPIFQSTLPARGATFLSFFSFFIAKHFNPRSPHGERRDLPATRRSLFVISIHAPRTGSDLAALSCRCCMSISIHAPRTGSDQRSVIIAL